MRTHFTRLDPEKTQSSHYHPLAARSLLYHFLDSYYGIFTVLDTTY